jgi:hypothetical protein
LEETDPKEFPFETKTSDLPQQFQEEKLKKIEKDLSALTTDINPN